MKTLPPRDVSQTRGRKQGHIFVRDGGRSYGPRVLGDGDDRESEEKVGLVGGLCGRVVLFEKRI